MTDEKERSKLAGLTRWAAGWVIGIGTLLLLMLGFLLVSTGGAVPNSFADRHPLAIRIIGYLFLMTATVVLLRTMTTKNGTPSRWVKALPGLLALATINALFAFHRGYVVSPSVPIPRESALKWVLLLLASAVGTAFAFKGRTLNVVDRIALIGFVVSMTWAIIWVWACRSPPTPG